MNPIKNIVIATAISALAFTASLSGAQAADAVETMKPLQGVSFHAGTTHAAGYYLRDNSTCELVLTIADEANFAPNRFEAAIETGRSTHYQLNGKSLEFACQANGTELETTAAN